MQKFWRQKHLRFNDSHNQAVRTKACKRCQYKVKLCEHIIKYNIWIKSCIFAWLIGYSLGFRKTVAKKFTLWQRARTSENSNSTLFRKTGYMLVLCSFWRCAKVQLSCFKGAIFNVWSSAELVDISKLYSV